MATKREGLQEKAKGLDGYTDKLTIAELEALISDNKTDSILDDEAPEPDLSAEEVKEVEIEEVEEVVAEKKVYEGAIDISGLGEGTVKAIAAYHNGLPNAKENLEAIVRSCIVVE